MPAQLASIETLQSHLINIAPPEDIPQEQTARRMGVPLLMNQAITIGGEQTFSRRSRKTGEEHSRRKYLFAREGVGGHDRVLYGIL